jgi:hypothetical protein
MLPLASSMLTKRVGAANLFIAAGVMLPQIIVALLSPSLGTPPSAAADRRPAGAGRLDSNTERNRECVFSYYGFAGHE